MRAIIAGGGVGGLTLALALHERGVEPLIIEQAPNLRQRGVGIIASPTATRILAGLGLFERLDATGVRIDEAVFQTARGQEILRKPCGLDAGFEYPQFAIHRGVLQKALYDAVVARVGCDAVRAGLRLVDSAQTRRAVAATFVGALGGPAETIVGDVLIGADGINSVVRRSLHGDEGPPRWSGVMMWRGAAWTKAFRDGRAMVVAGGSGARLTLYPIRTDPDRPGETLTSWTVYAKVGAWNDACPSDESATPIDAAPRSILGRFAVEGLDVDQMIQSTDAIYRAPMCDRDPLSRWGVGRITLMGDAAHPMYPVGSNAASQAILDAARLASFVVENSDPAEALASYEADRRPATSELVASSRRGGAERVIDLIEARAPGGFDAIDAVASFEELRAIVGDFEPSRRAVRSASTPPRAARPRRARGLDASA